jgi:hypothetical protein
MGNRGLFTQKKLLKTWDKIKTEPLYTSIALLALEENLDFKTPTKKEKPVTQVQPIMCSQGCAHPLTAG